MNFIGQADDTYKIALSLPRAGISYPGPDHPVYVNSAIPRMTLARMLVLHLQYTSWESSNADLKARAPKRRISVAGIR